jgi:hypothetical protein
LNSIQTNGFFRPRIAQKLRSYEATTAAEQAFVIPFVARVLSHYQSDNTNLPYPSWQGWNATAVNAGAGSSHTAYRLMFTKINRGKCALST